jgi:hypothetical protein
MDREFRTQTVSETTTAWRRSDARLNIQYLAAKGNKNPHYLFGHCVHPPHIFCINCKTVKNK